MSTSVVSSSSDLTISNPPAAETTNVQSTTQTEKNLQCLLNYTVYQLCMKQLLGGGPQGPRRMETEWLYLLIRPLQPSPSPSCTIHSLIFSFINPEGWMVEEFVCANSHSICLFVFFSQTTSSHFSSSSSSSTTSLPLFPHCFHKESGDSIWRDFFSMRLRRREWNRRAREKRGAGINR